VSSDYKVLDGQWINPPINDLKGGYKTPFTPFHLGPALALGLPLRKRMYLPTFMLANVVLDFEPLLVLIMGLRYPLHGYFHTFLAALLLEVVLGYAMLNLDGILRPLYGLLHLDLDINRKPVPFILAGASGTVLHVLLDSPLYIEMHPLYPLTMNPMYNPALSFGAYCICAVMGIFGLVYYAYVAPIHR